MTMMGSVCQHRFGKSLWRINGYAGEDVILRGITDGQFNGKDRAVWWIIFKLFYKIRDDLEMSVDGKFSSRYDGDLGKIVYKINSKDWDD